MNPENMHDGPVLVEDRFFDCIDNAIEHYCAHCDDGVNGNLGEETGIPEFAFVARQIPPKYDAGDLIYAIDEGIGPLDDDWETFKDAVSDKQQNELQEFLDAWIDRVNYKLLEPTKERIGFRELVLMHIRKHGDDNSAHLTVGEQATNFNKE